MVTWLGVDTGGTFTDFVYFDGHQLKVHKVLSTPEAPERAILQGVRELAIDTAELKLVHGSTVATNAVLEGKGVRMVYVGNRGFSDLIQIGRQARSELYNLQPERPRSLVEADCCLQIDTRLSADGEVLKAVTKTGLQQLVEEIKQLRPESVAINLLFSFLDDRQEKMIAEAIPDDIFVSRSSDVLPEYKEYERGMATVLNAYVGPLMEGYLERLEQGLEQTHVTVMQSSGGTIDAARAGRYAVNLLLSGPAGGLKGARYVAGLGGESRLLSFDMGGTSTDVALIDGEIGLTSEGRIGDYPVATPMVDMYTIGAGGGSIAQVDAGGMLLVGPESAGARPGPACYGQGGLQATVTDANLVLGRLLPESFLGGQMTLDLQQARLAIEPVAKQMAISVEQAAEGIVVVANEHMVKALRIISLQRGYDPEDFALVSFGGAGGLHVCALAQALEMTRALVPVQSGVLSALGMLVAAPAREMSQSVNRLVSELAAGDIEQGFARLRDSALQQMAGECAEMEAETKYSVDLRYQGQSFSLNLPWTSVDSIEEAFHLSHQKHYGHRLQVPVELVTLRVSVRGPAPSFALPENNINSHQTGPVQQVDCYGLDQQLPVYQRDKLCTGQQFQGPALVVETVATTFIDKGWYCRVDDWGNLHLWQ